jgi:hypothetical protein
MSSRLGLARVELVEIGAIHEHLAAHLQHGGAVPRSFSGIALIVRTFAVTSSPVSPSPRVAACTSVPFS